MVQIMAEIRLVQLKPVNLFHFHSLHSDRQFSNTLDQSSRRSLRGTIGSGGGGNGTSTPVSAGKSSDFSVSKGRSLEMFCVLVCACFPCPPFCLLNVVVCVVVP